MLRPSVPPEQTHFICLHCSGSLLGPRLGLCVQTKPSCPRSLALCTCFSQPPPPVLSRSQRLVFAPWPHWGHSPSAPAPSPFNPFPARHIDFLIKQHPCPEPGPRNTGLAELKSPPAARCPREGAGPCASFLLMSRPREASPRRLSSKARSTWTRRDRSASLPAATGLLPRRRGLRGPHGSGERVPRWLQHQRLQPCLTS